MLKCALDAETLGKQLNLARRYTHSRKKKNKGTIKQQMKVEKEHTHWGRWEMVRQRREENEEGSNRKNHPIMPMCGLAITVFIFSLSLLCVVYMCVCIFFCLSVSVLANTSFFPFHLLRFSFFPPLQIACGLSKESCVYMCVFAFVCLPFLCIFPVLHCS